MMVQHAMAANARMLKAFPKGFALDETHHPHNSMLQQFVRTDELLQGICGGECGYGQREAHGMDARRSSITTSRLHQSASLASLSNRLRTYIGCKMH